MPRPAAAVVEEMAAKGVLAGVPVSRLLPGNEALACDLIVASTEINTDADRARFAVVLGEVLA